MSRNPYDKFHQLGERDARELREHILAAFYARYPEVLASVNRDSVSFGSLTEKTKSMVRFAFDRDAARASLDIPDQVKQEPWQNLDSILGALERAGCCTENGYIHAAEDVVANALRDWLRACSVSSNHQNGAAKELNP
jgi:hypothetical protein